MKKELPYDSYTKAYEDINFLKSAEARSIRLQLEMLKPQVILHHKKIGEGIVCFGSARILEPKMSKDRVRKLTKALKEDPKNQQLKDSLEAAKGLDKLAPYYDIARKFASLVVKNTKKKLSVITGGGPGIMEAANRGADDEGGKSIGFNITLPHEQHPNPYITKGYAFSFHYFAVRKMHLVMRSKAVVVFPGGYGTFDEMFEILTLVQTGKNKKIPIVLVGKKFWQSIFDFKKILSYGLIGKEDQYYLVDTAEEAWKVIKDFYNNKF